MTVRKKGRVYCVTGIDTDIGKTIATGLIARGLIESGLQVITQKGVQTGCDGISEDIVRHRELMGMALLDEDREGLTCQYLFRTPCSPHLAADLEKELIEPRRITQAAEELRKRYDIVLVEGAGGLFVPLQEEYTFIDYLQETKWPVLLVTSSRLGSINHTLASFEALSHRGIKLAGVIYNQLPETDSRIAEDTLNIISLYLRKYGYDCPLVEMYAASSYEGVGSCIHFKVLCDG